ncbi:nicotinate (nicotinamide) nucleotide adenylyltransferase [Candidatus Woesebacteria bacterium]|nr:nicotinate (nicotinamide) nucleotide adenylyltransferase [Candidatus Woesebacteria bacterium]
MKITLFGAAFNPPHLGHQQIVVSLLKEKLTDAVWLVPVKEHPFGKRLAPAADRLAMTQLLANSIQEELSEVGENADEQAVRVETFELDEPGISYSFRTLLTLSERYPDHQFSFVIGSDNLTTFHKWDQYEAMLAQFSFFVYPRHGFPFDPLLAGMTPMQNMAEVRVSSTQIREKLKTNETIDTLVPTMVVEYIRDRNLYR